MSDKISKPGGETPTRSKSAASPGSKAAQIYRAQVLTVNAKDYTVDVQYEAYPYSTHLDIPWMVPYVHPNQGEGMVAMPEVGSTCWVCQPSETGRDAFVLGWTPVQETGSYRAGRENLNPGDLHFSTRDENFLFLRRGGIVQIGATPICQRIYIPIRNVIRDMAENYELSTPAGDLTWSVDRIEDQGDGKRGCLFTLLCKEYSDDPNANPLAVLKIGSHGEGQETILTLETRDSGGGSIKTKLSVTKDGKISWTAEDDVSFSFKKNLSIEVGETTSINSDGTMTLSSDSQVNVSGSAVHVKGGGAKLDLAGSAALNGSSVDLGDATFPAVALTPSFQSWVMAVTALFAGIPGSPVLKVILPPPLMKSSKVKV